MEAEYAAGTGSAVYSATIRCGIPIDSQVTPTAFTFSYLNDAGAGVNSYLDLAFPANGFVVPLVDFKSASISQVNDDQSSTAEVTVEFTTDTAGQYFLALLNGPSSDPINYNDGKWANFWCSSGSNKKAARIQYAEGGVLFYVAAPSTKDPFKCTLLFGNRNSNKFVASQRLAARIQIATVIVTRGLDYKAAPAGVWATLAQCSTSGSQLGLSIESSSVEYTATPIKSNSTVTFKFSKHIDVSTLLLNESLNQTSYRNNNNCNFMATSFVDAGANTITLKDVEFSSKFLISTLSVPSSFSLRCTFEFSGSKVFKYQDSADLATVLVSIDGRDLVATQAPTKEAPIYFNTVDNWANGSTEQTVSEEGGKYTVVDVFQLNDNYANMHTNMQHPLLMVQITGNQLFNMEDYEKQVSCEATSPISTKFGALKLNFDPKNFFWSVKLDTLVNVDSYSILIKCTRSFPKLTKYGLDSTPSNELSVGVYNILDGKRYFSSQSTSPPWSPKQPIPTPASSVYPTARSVEFSAVQGKFTLKKYRYMGAFPLL